MTVCSLTVLTPFSSGAVDSTAASSAVNATRASPLAERAIRPSSSSETAGLKLARPRSSSASACWRIVLISSSESWLRTSTRERESSAPVTSNDGFSVVAPMSVTVPFSTACSSASCCDLLKRWISSMKSTVRLPRERRALLHAAGVRYRREAYELTGPMADGPVTREVLDALAEAFHDRHRRTYGHANPNETVQLVNLRLT